MHNPYQSYVQNIATELYRAKDLKAFGSKAVVEKEHKVLLFSPHPDDECITGLLARRFQVELGCQVVNIPMTFGSKEERRQGRLEELENACAYLGWQNYVENFTLDNLLEGEVIQILEKFQPVAIFFPHAHDWNSRHIEVHKTMMAALARMPEDFSTLTVETEFWGAMDDPNLNVEGTSGLVADLVAATSLHKEEVARNPYHLRLPGWMQDNVRRGAELVGGQGEEAPDFSFSTLYRMKQWSEGRMQNLFSGGKHVGAGGGNLLEFAIWK